MAGLKEEWTNLIKLRGLGKTDEVKKEEIRNRIFNNFYTIRQENLDKKPTHSNISVKKEYEDQRSEFLQSLSKDLRSKTPEIQKNFEFGLKNINFPPSQIKLNRPDLKSEDIWSMNDSPFSKPILDPIPDRFEQVSIIDNNGGITKTGKFSKLINIFSDLSPITRYLSSLEESEEEKYLKETSSHDSYFFSLFHLVHVDITADELSMVTWKESSDFTRGLIFRNQVTSMLNPPSLIKNRSVTEKEKITVSQCYSEQPVQFENSILKSEAIKVSKSTSPLIPTAGGVDSLEKELLDMMDQISRNYKSASSEDKIKILLKKTQDKLEQKSHLSSNTQILAIYQFLQEYLKIQEKKPQPAPKRPFQSKPSQKKSVTPVKSTRKMPNIESKSSLNSDRESKWFGGSKHQADFEDEDWVSSKIEKKKTETRNEMLYKLSKQKLNS